MLAGVNDAFLGATKIFSVPLMLFTFVTTVLAFYLAFGKYGSIRLGEGKPEYSNFSYITMMALAALASAAVYWSFTEWAAYYEAPGIHLEPYSVEALEASLGYSFFHWGDVYKRQIWKPARAIWMRVFPNSLRTVRCTICCCWMRPISRIIKAGWQSSIMRKCLRALSISGLSNGTGLPSGS